MQQKYLKKMAQKILELNNTKVFVGDEQILLPPNTPPDANWELKIPSFSNIIDTHPEEKRKEYFEEIEDYDELVSKGFVITVGSPKQRTFRGQKVQYFLRRKADVSGLDYGTIPAGHQIEYNPRVKAVRGFGRNFSETQTKWVPLIKKSFLRERDVSGSDILNQWMGTKESTTQQIRIKELPVMMTDDFRLVCIPQTADEPTIGITGEKSKGKSMLLNRICSVSYWKWKKHNLILNDSLRECGCWVLPWREKHSFSYRLKELGEATIGLPAVYLHLEPATQIENEEEGIGLRISLPSKELMQDYETVLQIKKEWRFKGSLTRFKGLFVNDDGKPNKEFLDLWGRKDFKIIKDYVEDKIKRASMAEKINSVLKDIFYSNFMDSSNNSPAYWTVEIEREVERKEKMLQDIKTVLKDNTIMNKLNEMSVDSLKKELVQLKVPTDLMNKLIEIIKLKDSDKKLDALTLFLEEFSVKKEIERRTYKPWIAAMYAGVVPIIETFEARTYPFFPHIQKFIIEDIFNIQKNDPYFVNNNIQIWVFIDEMAGIASKINKTVASPAIELLITEGRPQRIGTVYTDLNYTNIFDRVRRNTNYLFSFNQKGMDAKMIVNDFGLHRSMENKLKHLKEFEAVAITTHHFVVYDLVTGERELVDEPIIGKSLPPINQHKAPTRTDESEGI